MGLILNISTNKEPYGVVKTSIGDLAVYYLSVKDATDLTKSLEKRYDDITPMVYILGMAKFVCFQAHELDENQHKPESPVLKVDEISRLSKQDLDNIAKLYIKNNKHLYRDKKITYKKHESGDTEHIVTYGDTIHKKSDSESWVEYLYRLTTLDNERRKKQNIELLKSMKESMSFSSDLKNNISDTLQMGNNFSETLEKLKNPFDDALASINRFSGMDAMSKINALDFEPIVTPSIDFQKIHRDQEKSRLKPFGKLGKKLDELIGVTVDSGEFMVKMNETQTEIAEELKCSGDKATFYSSFNIKLTIFVIVLSIIGLLFTGYSLFNDSLEKLSLNINKSLVVSHEDNLQLISIIKENNANNSSQFSTLLIEQNLKIKKLTDVIEKQSSKIIFLENKIELYKDVGKK